MPSGPWVSALPVQQHQPDDLAEGHGDDGEIVAAQPQHRKAEDDAPERGEDAGERQADPEREAEVFGEQRVGIGADRIEGDVAEVEQAGEADDDVQAPAQHHIGEDHDAEVEQVAVVVEHDRQCDGEGEQGRRRQLRQFAETGARRRRQHGAEPERRARRGSARAGRRRRRRPRPMIASRLGPAGEHRVRRCCRCGCAGRASARTGRRRRARRSSARLSAVTKSKRRLLLGADKDDTPVALSFRPFPLPAGRECRSAGRSAR